MSGMNTFAMWLGYAVMVLVGLAVVTGFAAALLQHLWRTILRDVPSMAYIREAVGHYKTIKPAPKPLQSEVDHG